MKQTPFHSIHRQLGAKMVPFGGYEMPVQYSSIIEEHKAVRTAVGVFDVSHMGEFVVKGKNAQAFLQCVTVNDVAKLIPEKLNTLRCVMTMPGSLTTFSCTRSAKITSWLS